VVWQCLEFKSFLLPCIVTKITVSKNYYHFLHTNIKVINIKKFEIFIITH